MSRPRDGSTASASFISRSRSLASVRPLRTTLSSHARSFAPPGPRPSSAAELSASSRKAASGSLS